MHIGDPSFHDRLCYNMDHIPHHMWSAGLLWAMPIITTITFWTL